MSTPKIRSGIRPGDLAFILQSHHEWYWPNYGYSERFEYYVARAIAESVEMSEDKESRSRWWFVEADGKVEGSLVLIDRGEVAQLRFFYLSPAVKGRGVGKQLMTRFADHLNESGFKSCYLWTTTEQTTARYVYERYGFTNTAEQVSNNFGVPQTELKYELTL